MFGIKNITAVEIDQLPYQKLPWYGHYWYGKIDQMVTSKDDNKEDKIMMMIEEKEISHMRMGGRKSEAQKA